MCGRRRRRVTGSYSSDLMIPCNNNWFRNFIAYFRMPCTPAAPVDQACLQKLLARTPESHRVGPDIPALQVDEIASDLNAVRPVVMYSAALLTGQAGVCRWVHEKCRRREDGSPDTRAIATTSRPGCGSEPGCRPPRLDPLDVQLLAADDLALARTNNGFRPAKTRWDPRAAALTHGLRIPGIHLQHRPIRCAATSFVYTERWKATAAA